VSAIPEHCEDGAARLSEADVAAMAGELDPSWTVDGTSRIERRLVLQDFEAALRLVNADAGGLTANDFSLARRIDALAKEN
jgi:pterin-4a-carbinolamine dehydratase